MAGLAHPARKEVNEKNEAPAPGATPALEARLDVALELPHRGSKRPPQALLPCVRPARSGAARVTEGLASLLARDGVNELE